MHATVLQARPPLLSKAAVLQAAVLLAIDYHLLMSVGAQRSTHHLTHHELIRSSTCQSYLSLKSQPGLLKSEINRAST